jgi:hypothetical protein
MAVMMGCDHKHGATTMGLLVYLRDCYEAYLREGEPPISSHLDERDVLKLLAGGNRKGIVFVELPDASLDPDGYAIDTWKNRLRIEPVSGLAGQIEIRSAGATRPLELQMMSGSSRARGENGKSVTRGRERSTHVNE